MRDHWGCLKAHKTQMNLRRVQPEGKSPSTRMHQRSRMFGIKSILIYFTPLPKKEITNSKQQTFYSFGGFLWCEAIYFQLKVKMSQFIISCRHPSLVHGTPFSFCYSTPYLSLAPHILWSIPAPLAPGSVQANVLVTNLWQCVPAKYQVLFLTCFCFSFIIQLCFYDSCCYNYSQLTVAGP